jgi:putative endonuclease
MIPHIEKGKSGEQLAIEYLTDKKFRIICSNWRFSRYEIDIIAEKDNVIHFIEVKTRHGNSFGFPEESVGRKKFKNMQKAAAAFLSRFSKEVRIQFDIVAITRIAGKKIEYFFMEDVYIY